MAQPTNSYGSLGTFTVLSRIVRDDLEKILVPASAFSFNAGGDIMESGSAVVAHLNTNVTPNPVQTVSIGSPIDYTTQMSQQNTTAVTVNLNKWASDGFFLPEYLMNITPVKDLAQKFAGKKIYNIGLSILNDLYSDITSANFSNSVTISGASFTYSVLNSSVFPVVTNLNMVPELSSLVLNNTAFYQLVSSLPSLPGWDVGQAVLKGQIPAEQFGLKQIIRSPVVPTGLTGFISTPDSIAIASRVLAPITPSETYGESFIVADPERGEQGFSLRARKWTPPDAPQTNCVWDCIYGHTPFNPNTLVRLI